MVGKYVQIRDSYLSLHEALMHAGLKSRTRVNIHYIESTDIEQHGTHALAGMDALEERARSDLGMIARNETFYQVVPAHPSDTPQAPTRTAAAR